MACEAIGLVYAEFHGLDFLALRVTAIYGFGMRNPVHIKPMVENAVLGKPTRFETGGPMKRDYTHVLDCASAVVAAVEKPPQQIGAERIINVAAGKSRPVPNWRRSFVRWCRARTSSSATRSLRWKRKT